MSDPAAPFSDRRSRPEGVGPYATGDEFPEVGNLGVGESYRLDLRRYERGRYTELSPAGYDAVSVVNTSAEPLRVTLNETNSYVVPADTSKSLTHAGTYVVSVVNLGGNPLGSTDAVTVELQKEPLGADEQARREAAGTPIGDVIQKFTGLRPGGL